MNLISVNATSAPQPSSGYSQALDVREARRILFISGQIPETSDGQVPTDFRSQAKVVWSNILAQLEAANMSVPNLVKVTMFLSSREYASFNSEIRQEVLGAHSPALTVIITGIYDEKWLLEIEAVAAD
ncbi:MAG: RidA family protein [Anaerolineaceae bacterium]